MYRILQISDIHFGTVNANVLNALVHAVRQLSPALCVVSGDITQRATRSEFLAANAFLKTLPAPVLCIPGNHDIPLYALWTRFLNPYGRYRRYLHKEVEPLFESGSAMVIGVNTTTPFRHKRGIVTDAQIRRVVQLARENSAGKSVLVVAHHPFHVLDPADQEQLVENHEAAIRAWSAAGVDLILGGHIHMPFVYPLTQRYPDLVHPMLVVQGGTTTSFRVRRHIPNSLNVLDLYPEKKIHITTWTYQSKDDSHPNRFMCVEKDMWKTN
ncbi:metallophosphoesterase family protein [Advenella mimigardefordensis]|uniref:Putative metallophosphoesterase n=1 Tax=Advenella mimigardefordensis (strain DSM 17166 / LMG 22922 / DPN7) TaxID=1247726 RepID=W0PAL1_ADVMD|nr:metallophosphoesterase [Advenella mimigardefordensis]AHG63746.1 putative metallophosphoesterase [Advenella mimigardefordensis DPN7]